MITFCTYENTIDSTYENTIDSTYENTIDITSPQLDSSERVYNKLSATDLVIALAPPD